jgi:hypothetical protein
MFCTIVMTHGTLINVGPVNEGVKLERLDITTKTRFLFLWSERLEKLYSVKLVKIACIL